MRGRSEEENLELENKLRKFSRRKALSTAGKIAIGVVVAGAIAGVGGYLAGVSQVKPTETITRTVTQTVGAGAAVTVTQTQTVAQTITQTVTKTATVAPVTKTGVIRFCGFGGFADVIPKIPQLADLEGKIGMKAEFDVVPWPDLLSKYLLNFQQPTGIYDVITINSAWHAAACWRYLEDLTPYIEAEDYDIGRFHKLFIDELYWWSGERYKSRPGGDKLIALGGTPFGIEFAIRKDVLERHGIPVPDHDWTLDDLEDIAREITNPSAGIYGLGMTLYQHRAIDMTCMLAKGISGNPRWSWLTEDCRPNVDTPEFREACQIIMNWLKEGILHPGSLELASGMDWTLYSKEVVMIDVGWIGGAPGVPDALLPKTAFLTPPMGPKGRCGGFGQHALAIPTNAKNKREAWEFIKWYNSLDVQYELAKLQVIPSLAVLLESPTLQEKQPWIKPIVIQALAGVEQLPKIEIALEVANLILGTECDNYWAGRKSLDTAIKDMVDGTTRALKEAGFI